MYMCVYICIYVYICVCVCVCVCVCICMYDAGNEERESNKWGDKAHLRIIAPPPSGGNIAKTQPSYQ
jgi:hypothetical protein